jgi:hypothetical protein
LARPMIARAIRYRPMRALAPVLESLASAPDVDSRREAVLAMRAARDVQFIDTLIGLLTDRALRDDVREALVELGDPALDKLEAVLCVHSTAFSLRVHLPRTIVRFQGRRAADILIRHLTNEPRGMIRYKSLRALGRLVANDPLIELDEDALDSVVSGTVESSFRALHWRVLLRHEAERRPNLRTASHELLVELLRDKERLSTERLFRTLGLRYRDENVARIYHGLHSGNRSLKSSSRELLESALPSRLGSAVIALTDDLPDEARLDGAAHWYGAEPIDFEDLLATLVADPGAALSAVAAHYAEEIGVKLDPHSARSPQAEQLERDREPGGLGRLLERVQGPSAAPDVLKGGSLS